MCGCSSSALDDDKKACVVRVKETDEPYKRKEKIILTDGLTV